jgi:uncharacterized membrane protein
MKKLNKTSAAVVGGAIIAVIGAFIAITPEIASAIQTLVVAGLVWMVPNDTAK